MAVIREQKSAAWGIRFQAIVRRRGHSLSRVFTYQRDAESWARRVEAAIDVSGPDLPFDKNRWLLPVPRPNKGDPGALPPDEQEVPCREWSLGRALRHYGETVTPTKKGARQERLRLVAWRKHDLAKNRLDRLTTDQVQLHVDARAAAGRAATTIRNEVLLLSALYRHAETVWRLDLTNPIAKVRLPGLPAGRQRRLEEAEGDMQADEQRILNAAMEAGGEAFADLVAAAIETGMRQGELLALSAAHVKKRAGATVIELPDSKNGHPRRVVANSRAVEVLARRVEAAGRGRLFPMTQSQVTHLWKRTRTKAGVAGLRFHDLRHEALSRFASAGLNLGELQAQSGHRTAQILLRYLNARTGDIAGKLG